MRIVHVLAEPARLGGAETYALALAAAQAARGDEVTLAHVRPGSEAPPRVALRHAPDAASLRAAFASASPDVAHVHGTPLDEASEAQLDGRAVVRSLHDFSFGCATGEHWFRSGAACTRGHGPGCLDGILRRGCAHRVDLREPLRRHREISQRLPGLRRSPAVVVYSETMRSAALANGFDAARVFVVPYFVERSRTPPAPPSGRSLAFVGRVVDAKGLGVALEALAAVPAAWDELHVAGDGWARPGAERLARSLGLEGRVRFHGWIGAAAAGEVLRRSRALLLPSRWPEPFGIAGLEALAAGRPVIASRTGGVADWLDDSSGILVPPGEPGALAAAVERLADDVLAARLGRAAWERAARFSPAAHLQALDAAYRAAAGSARAAA